MDGISPWKSGKNSRIFYSFFAHDGEKDGNSVPVLSAGDSCKQLAKNDAETEKDAE